MHSKFKTEKSMKKKKKTKKQRLSSEGEESLSATPSKLDFENSNNSINEEADDETPKKKKKKAKNASPNGKLVINVFKMSSFTWLFLLVISRYSCLTQPA
jgi:hypothetical protein